mmetsp:Transcript_4959/g.9136  ORF Transcript_4959/g.9136 Transcript_4959/m.9136 type:complete len:230 (+) Transcript_4959:3302-3991(+)
MQRRTAARQLSVLHDSNPIAQKVRFVHEMGREDHNPPFLGLANDVPHRSPRKRVDAAGGLVEKTKVRIADESHRDRKFAFLASGQSLRLHVDFLSKPHKGQCFRNSFGDFPTFNPFASRHNSQVFSDCEIWKQDIVLGTHAQDLLYGLQISRDCKHISGPSFQHGVAGSGVVHACEHVDSGGFPSSIVTQKREYLVSKHIYTEVVDCYKAAVFAFEFLPQIHDLKPEFQ